MTRHTLPSTALSEVAKTLGITSNRTPQGIQPRRMPELQTTGVPTGSTCCFQNN